MSKKCMSHKGMDCECLGNNNAHKNPTPSREGQSHQKQGAPSASHLPKGSRHPGVDFENSHSHESSRNDLSRDDMRKKGGNYGK